MRMINKLALADWRRPRGLLGGFFYRILSCFVSPVDWLLMGRVETKPDPNPSLLQGLHSALKHEGLIFRYIRTHGSRRIIFLISLQKRRYGAHPSCEGFLAAKTSFGSSIWWERVTAWPMLCKIDGNESSYDFYCFTIFSWPWLLQQTSTYDSYLLCFMAL